MVHLDLSSKAFPWYVLTVRSGRELTVSDTLSQMGYESYVPSVTETRKYSDRLKKVQQPLFPGYVFSRFDAERRLPILQLSYVMQIIGNRSGPIPVPDEEINGVRSTLQNLVPWQPWPFLQVGQTVKVMAGPLAGVQGRLERLHGETRLVIGISLLQRALAVEVDRECVRPIETRPARALVAAGSHLQTVA